MVSAELRCCRQLLQVHVRDVFSSLNCTLCSASANTRPSCTSADSIAHLLSTHSSVIRAFATVRCTITIRFDVQLSFYLRRCIQLLRVCVFSRLPCSLFPGFATLHSVISHHGSPACQQGVLKLPCSSPLFLADARFMSASN